MDRSRYGNVVTTARIALGRFLARLALRCLEPRDGEPWDPERSLLIDELVEALNR